MRLFLDHLQVRIGDLDIRPDDYRKGVALLQRPVPAAVAFEWNTHVDPSGRPDDERTGPRSPDL